MATVIMNSQSVRRPRERRFFQRNPDGRLKANDSIPLTEPKFSIKCKRQLTGLTGKPARPRV
jgi:hypothetical protein